MITQILKKFIIPDMSITKDKIFIKKQLEKAINENIAELFQIVRCLGLNELYFFISNIHFQFLAISFTNTSIGELRIYNQSIDMCKYLVSMIYKYGNMDIQSR